MSEIPRCPYCNSFENVTVRADHAECSRCAKTFSVQAETWKPAPGFPAYEVSDQGRVRRSAPELNGSSAVGRVLKAWKGAGGVPMVSLRRDGQTFPVAIAVLQADAFAPAAPGASA